MSDTKQMEAKDATGGNNFDHDRDVFSENQGFYRGLSYDFIGRFIAKTDETSIAARNICRDIEADELLDTEMQEVFPPERATYNKRKKSAVSKLKKARRTKTDLEKQKTELIHQRRALDDAGQSTRAMQVRLQIDAVQEQIDAINNSSDFKSGEKMQKGGYKKTYHDRYLKKNMKPRAKHWAALKVAVAKRQKDLKGENPHVLYENLMGLADFLEIGEQEKKILLFLLVYEQDEMFKTFIDKYMNKQDKGLHLALNKIFDIPVNDVKRILDGDSRMFELALAERKEEGTLVPSIGSFIKPILNDEVLDISALTAKVGREETAKFDWDSDHYAEEFGKNGEDLIALLQGYMEAKRVLRSGKVTDPAEIEILKELTRGVNILFAGLQDAGKTEAVYALCKKIGLTPVSIGEPKGAKAKSLSPEERIGRAMLASALFADKEDIALVMDEMIDCIPNLDPENAKKEGKQTLGKLFVNRFLENNEAPTFFTENNIRAFHPSILRRMTHSRIFSFPTRRVRQKLLQSMVDKYGLDLTPDQVAKIATSYRGVVGTFATAARATKRISMAPAHTGTQSDIMVRNIKENAGRQWGDKEFLTVRYAPPGDEYNLALLNARRSNQILSYDQFSGLVDTLVALPEDRRNFSLINEGPPGTGKDEFILYLAERMGMEPLVIQPSDIMDMWVGENEKNVRKAFTTAEENGMFLLFKEGDTYVRNRGSAERSWEVSLVNEMLICMERAKCPFAFSSNLWDVLDNATYRRFTMRLGFDFLNVRQRYVAFQHFFGMEAPARSLDNIDRLTPGDFAKLKKDSALWGTITNPALLVRDLRAISDEKPQEQQPRDLRQPAGFAFAGAVTSDIDEGRVLPFEPQLRPPLVAPQTAPQDPPPPSNGLIMPPAPEDALWVPGDRPRRFNPGGGS